MANLILHLIKWHIKLSCSIILIMILVDLSSASTPYDPYDPPVDSMVTWFNDYCNQHQQIRAFWQVVEWNDWPIPPYKTAEIKPEWDLTLVKDAFVYFVESISINKQMQGSCSVFYPDSWLGNYEDNTKGIGWEGPVSTDLILSLYINLGYTQDLYQIADSIYTGNEKMRYFSMIWNLPQLGTGYFQHLETSILSNPNSWLEIDIAFNYLNKCRIPQKAMTDIALNILHLAAISTSSYQRLGVTYILCDAYNKGYSQVKSDIENLVDDADLTVNNMMRSEIRSIQQNSHRMMNFLNE